MLAIISSATILGTKGLIIRVELDAGGGIGTHHIVGLPDAAVRESLDRIEAAIKNSDYSCKFFKKFTVNLAPADIKKEGSYFDLPIAVGLLATEGYFDIEKLSGFLIVGELSLSGELQPIRGTISIADCCQQNRIKNLIVPYANRKEASLVKGINVYPVKNLQETIEVLRNSNDKQPYQNKEPLLPTVDFHGIDYQDVKGQFFARRALEIAAAGGHNILLIGSPGCGKTMMARRFPTILPSMNYDESLEVTRIYSISGMQPQGLVSQRPFRSPHHTISNAGLAGGGSIPRPGEITLAHKGVLFLDEFPEFGRDVLEILRQPLEDKQLTISRSRISLTYPAEFQLIAAMNPCPCGYHLHKTKSCICSPDKVNRYWHKISGPLLDRLDIIIELPDLDKTELQQRKQGEPSANIRKRVILARKKQQHRFMKYHIDVNAAMQPAQLREFARPDKEAALLLNTALEKLNLSARAYDRVIKISRTIADLNDSNTIGEREIAEALQLRSSILQ